MTFNRYLAIARIAAVVLLVLGLAATAHAGTRMYSGAINVEAFGNDTTTGATIKLQRDDFGAYPWDQQCDIGLYHTQETVTFPTQGGEGGIVTFTLPRYGGQPAIHDTNQDGVGDRALGCLQSQIEIGRPMLHTGSISTTGVNAGDPNVAPLPGSTTRTPGDPRKFTIPAGHFTAMQTGNLSLTPYGPYAFDVQYTNFVNPVATFAKGGGAGNFTWSETRKNKAAGKVIIKSGANRFGGTMQMLGSFFSNEGFYYLGHLSVAQYSWLFQYNGVGAVTAGITGGGARGAVIAPGVTSVANSIYTTIAGVPIPSNEFAFAFSWTTGTVSITALHGPFPTVQARKGFDNRDAQGAGEIQMVTPMLSRWVWLAGNYDTASIGHIKLDFAPEPQEWLMLAAGVSMLGLLYRSNRG